MSARNSLTEYYFNNKLERDRFWEISLESNRIKRRWGDICSVGQEKQEVYSSSQEARDTSKRLISKKKQNDYVLIDQPSEIMRSIDSSNKRHVLKRDSFFRQLIDTCAFNDAAFYLAYQYKRVKQNSDEFSAKSYLHTGEEFILRKLFLERIEDINKMPLKKYISNRTLMSRLSELLPSKGDELCELIFLIQNFTFINPNGINTDGYSPLRSVLKYGDDEAVKRLVQLGADPRVNHWIYSKDDLDRINSIFHAEFRNPADSDKTRSLRRTPNIRVAQQLLEYFEMFRNPDPLGYDGKYIYAEAYGHPNIRSYEEYNLVGAVMTEFNHKLISDTIKKILSGKMNDLAQFDDQVIIVNFYGRILGDLGDYTLQDLFGAAPCADCVIDNDPIGQPFWIISNKGKYTSTSRIRFYLWDRKYGLED